jgi:hypothetical protein
MEILSDQSQNCIGRCFADWGSRSAVRARRRLRERAHRSTDLSGSIVEIRPVLRLCDRSERSGIVI